MKIIIFLILLVVFVFSFLLAVPNGPNIDEAIYFFFASGAGLFLMIYLAPTLHAYTVRHPDRRMILLVNLIGGWTGIFWIAAFVVACNGKGAQRAALAAPPLPATLTEQLHELEQLRHAGIITTDEYHARRGKLLS